MIGTGLVDRAESKAEYAQLRKIYYNGPISVLDGISDRVPDVLEEVTSLPKEVLPGFEPLIAENEDTAGWIRIEGTSIDYPVVQGIDNDYYLHHSFQKKENPAGTIFMDYNNDSTDPLRWRNIVLYGHRMKNGTMFKDLSKFMDRDFFKEHRVIRFDLPNEEIEWEIFSVYVTDISFDYIRTSFADDRDYRFFQDTVLAKSEHDAGIKLGSKDEILTLSTCDYAFDNARLVVHARRIGEPKPG
jgi:sortase B